ncbi:DNA-binding response regulator [Arenicella chitinivorans]|uniref:DNA-binding response regulator n=1 Tax=Arenicella chitinivorans TaxID=1329800 RepID=A0A918RKU9_9GAMM|nr:response regulator transcription factor [Arenicella chitinivorans]GHA03130.1 DNA-binding response regulator [Arenicella chitinivorans]
MRILVVEDDQEIQGQLQRKLGHLGYQVSVAEDGVEALFYLSEYEIALAIVDLGLPRMDGMQLIQQLRTNNHDLPVLILTARTGWKSKVEGLNSGADDYLVKPFQFEELVARVSALLRRSTGRTKSKLQIGPICLDLSSQIICVNNEEVNLTAFEFKVLEYFMMNPQKITSKFTLIDQLYGVDEETESNVIEVIIARLRKKLDPSGTLQPIETLRGRGYRFRQLAD